MKEPVILQPSDFISSSAYLHYKELADKPAVKPYLVYMNKFNDVWLSDAYVWYKAHGYVESDFEEILSEVVFYTYLNKGLLNNRPCIFVSERQKGNKMRGT